MKFQFKFRMSVVALGVLAALGSGQAIAQTNITDPAIVYISGNNDSSNHGGEGVFITSNSGSGSVPVDQAYLKVLTDGTATIRGSSSVLISSPNTYVSGNLSMGITSTLTSTNIQSDRTMIITGNNDNSGAGEGVVIHSSLSGTGGNISVLDTGVSVSGGLSNTGNLTNSGTLNQVGVANINATGTAASNIGAAGNTTSINSSTVNVGTGAFTTAVTVGSTQTGTTVTERGGDSTLSLVNGTSSLTSGTNGLTSASATGNTLDAAVGSNVISAATSNALTAGSTNTITGGTGNSIIATTGNNVLTASSGNNNITASAVNNIEAPTNNIGVATAASINNIGGTAASTNTIKGVTSINASINAATNINTGTSTAAVMIGNTGVNTTNTVNAYSGNTTLSLANNTASLTAGSTLASNGTSGTTSALNSGGLTVYNTAQTVASSVGGIVTGKSYQNKINGNLFVDGNVYINGTLDYVSSNSANTTVIGASSATSNLAGATTGTTAGTAIVLKGSTGTQTVVDANGKLTNVAGTAAQSTASLTLTNGIGNTHGLVVTETQATLSGGTHSSSLTMGDNGATFSEAANGAPVQVHGVNDGTADFDAVNVRQFAGAIASVTAMANIPQVDQDKTYALGVGVGNFMGKTALAAGVTHRFTRNGVIKGSISSAMSGSDTTTVGLGAAWSF